MKWCLAIWLAALVAYHTANIYYGGKLMGLGEGGCSGRCMGDHICVGVRSGSSQPDNHALTWHVKASVITSRGADLVTGKGQTN